MICKIAIGFEHQELIKFKLVRGFSGRRPNEAAHGVYNPHGGKQWELPLKHRTPAGES